MRHTIIIKTYQAFFRRLKAGEKPGFPRSLGRHQTGVILALLTNSGQLATRGEGASHCTA